MRHPLAVGARGCRPADERYRPRETGETAAAGHQDSVFMTGFYPRAGDTAAVGVMLKPMLGTHMVDEPNELLLP
jgi:hypothetical protein